MKNCLLILLSVVVFSCSEEKLKNETVRIKQKTQLAYNSKSVNGEYKIDLEFNPFLELNGGNDINSNKAIKVIGNVTYELRRLSVRKFLQVKTNLDSLSLDSLEYEMREEMIFVLEIATLDNKEIFEEEYTGLAFEESVKYAAFNLQDDLYLVSGEDTIPCANAQIERTFKLAPFKRFMLNFGGVKDQENYHLVYKDKLLKNGIVKFNLFKNKNNLES